MKRTERNKELENHDIIMNNYYWFATAKRLPHFTQKKSRHRKRKQITKIYSAVSVSVCNKTQLRSFDSQARPPNIEPLFKMKYYISNIHEEM